MSVSPWYFMALSPWANAPDLIWSTPLPTARSAMKVSSVSPDRWEIMQAIPRERAAAIASNVWLTVPTWFF